MESKEVLARAQGDVGGDILDKPTPAGGGLLGHMLVTGEGASSGPRKKKTGYPVSKTVNSELKPVNAIKTWLDKLYKILKNQVFFNNKLYHVGIYLNIKLLNTSLTQV